MMKRTAFILLSTLLVLPRLSFAAPYQAIGNLGELDEFIENNLEDASAGAEDEADDGAELDEEGERTYKELVEWADTHPEEFQKMLDTQPGEEDLGEDEEIAEDASAYCANPYDPARLWDAKARRKRRKRRPRCTAAVLKTHISTCCLLFVRTKLGLPSNPRSAHAKDYGPVLRRHGYCAIKTSPERAPVGAVIIYTGGPSGHIELKRGKHSYWWGPTNRAPATKWKKKKRLKAVYVKCGKKKKK